MLCIGAGVAADPSTLMELLLSVLGKEREMWTKSGFAKFDLSEGSPKFELLEERTVFIGPHRIPTAFYQAKLDDPTAKRRASVMSIAASMANEEATGPGTDAEKVKEALIKNPAVMQLLNPASKKGAGQAAGAAKAGPVVFKFEADGPFFQLPATVAVGRAHAGSVVLKAEVRRVVNGDEVARTVTVVIRGASARLYDLLLETARDPSKASAAGAQPTDAVFRESGLGFQPPAHLEEALMPTEPDRPIVVKLDRPKKAKRALMVPEAADPSQSTKQCAHCGSRGTPQWRRGPDGAGTLCNACGVKWKHGKLGAAKAPVALAPKRPVVVDERQPAPKPAPEPAKKESVMPLKKRKFLQSSYASRNTSLEDVAPSTPHPAASVPPEPK